METTYVWGIYYKSNYTGKWSEWSGPCGIGCMSFKSKLPIFPLDVMYDRPFFFRTRAQARIEAYKWRRDNLKTKVVKFKLMFEEANYGKEEAKKEKRKKQT